MKSRISMMLAGFILSVVVFGGVSAYADGILATPSTHAITVDDVPVSVKAYTINGSNYFKLRDIAALVDFGVNWNQSTRTIEIDTKSYYSEESVEQIAKSNSSMDLYSARKEIVDLINNLRRENSLPLLTMDENLMAAAQVRAEESARAISYRHTRPDGSDNDTVLLHTGNLLLGENMGMKDLEDNRIGELAEIQVRSWSNSLEHCKNMLNTIYHSMGTGIAQDQYGMYYVVLLLAGGNYVITGIDQPISH